MTVAEFALALGGGVGFAVLSGGICGVVIGYGKIDLMLAGLMGMFYGALAAPGIGPALILALIFG